jgi:hypothetical protein
MLDGRLYNYPKPGAVEFKGKESAAQAQDAARAAAYEIHGLGRVHALHQVSFSKIEFKKICVFLKSVCICIF